jgi:endonuclease/exonuclease/phosphatase family metal-dependent hydrolase
VGQPLLAGGSIPLETVRVLTLNLRGQSGDWSARRQILVAGLRALQPDLVAFQETIVTDAYDQVADLLGKNYHIAHQSRGLVPAEPAGFHVASIASRWPITRELRNGVERLAGAFAADDITAAINELQAAVAEPSRSV